jgi:hypothetical protein
MQPGIQTGFRYDLFAGGNVFGEAYSNSKGDNA